MQTATTRNNTPETPIRQVSFLDLKGLIDPFRDEIDRAIRQVIDRGAYIGGPELEAFEKNFAQWVGKDLKGIGCSNGTSAITLAAMALNLPAGSEAIVPAMTFFATASGLAHAGLKVKLVDIDPKTYLMDVDALEAAITPNTKLIAPVHLYGQMVAMDRVREIADKHGCKILEDAAQAHGATWKQKHVGYWGDIATYSFYPGKNLGAFGDAGAVVTRDPELAEQVYALAHQGGRKKYQHDVLGGNFRLDNLQAAILGVKLQHIDKWNNARRKVADYYRSHLSGVQGLTLPTVADGAVSVFHLYVVQVENRDDFQQHLKARGVSTGIHYPNAIHELGAFDDQFKGQSFPQAERLARHGISLPMCPMLSSTDLEQVVSAVKSYFA